MLNVTVLCSAGVVDKRREDPLPMYCTLQAKKYLDKRHWRPPDRVPLDLTSTVKLCKRQLAKIADIKYLSASTTYSESLNCWSSRLC